MHRQKDNIAKELREVGPAWRLGGGHYIETPGYKEEKNITG
jgi:hypothetical protein